MYPETGYKEVQTKARLISFLAKNKEFDQSEIKNYATTGFTYDIKGLAKPEGKDFIIGFRADMDALPMKELNTFPYCSKNQNAAHSCGHDGHMAILLATADVLLRSRSKIPSNKAIRLIFQPAEEGLHGGDKMVKEGALKGANEVYALHSWSLPFGKFGICKEGAMTTSCLRFRIDITGKGSHGATPENGKDPITALCQTHTALHSIISRGISAKDMGVCTIGEIHGGTVENVIPDFATMGGTIRTSKSAVQELIKSQLETITENVAKALGCLGKVRYIEETPAVINSKEQATILRQVVSELVGEESVTEEGMSASEDYSYMTNAIPGAFMLVGYAIPGKEIIMNHNPQFDFNEDLIAPSALAWIKLLEKKFNLLLC